ncbi:WSC-domain-containing protein [Trichoderma citrinoviride]|uniref:WSC-domain-containing protein n=1 Tax=Trichoderma citrinoviride TaxID=58853 RepID=A0A2T4BHM4_9HYPO|nr:WSC-domain-containing protein [Trichoderma citrinoviride]PTB68800.1 WSC-domain-containing protein [Trichoderma citrinoviride]
MTNQPSESIGPNWPPHRLSAVRRRALLLAGLFVLSLTATLFVRLVAIEAATLEQQTLVKRQFQLGGFLGSVFREVIGARPMERPTVAQPVKQDATASTSSVIVKTSTAATILIETTKPSMQDTPKSNFSGSGPDQLLETLAAALPSSMPDHRHKSTLADMIANQPNAQPISVNSSPSSPHTPHPIGILGGVSGGGPELRIHNARAISDKPSSKSSADGPTFLSDMSKIVAEISDIDPIAAAKLTDTVLDALHVDSSAIASAIPKVATQAAVSAADLLPLIIPAVAQAMDQPLPQVPSVSSLDMAETLDKVLQQGTTVINDLSRAMEDITDPSLLGVLNELAMIVGAVSNYLEKPLCAVDRAVNGTSFEAVIPCDSAEAQSLNSTGQLTTLAAPMLPEPTQHSSSSGATATMAPPVPYSSDNQAPSPNPASPSQPPAEGPSKTSSPSPANGENGNGPVSNGGAPAETPSPASACPACPSCEHTNGPSPCPGRGYRCDECLNGWFCPPQETPAQVVPCGLGWPCYHCSEGWFCTPDATPAPTSPPSSAAGPSSENTGKPGTDGTTAPTALPSASDAGDIPAGWSHRGCFQDAISRVLLNSKPVHYVQGNMSSMICADHCQSDRYEFAGTENGNECWCGTSIRDDAVKLPDSQCGEPCGGQPTESCGGNWTMNVFSCSDEAGARASDKSTGGFMYQLLSTFRGNNRGTIHHPF